MKTHVHFLKINLSQIFLEWKTFHTKDVVEIKTKIYFEKLFFENCGIYELNFVEPGRTHMII